MMQELQRVTTEYVEHEDRLRLSSVLKNNAHVVLWLTPRLLHRLVPALFNWLEKSAAMHVPRAEVLHQMVQHRAQAQLPQQAAVVVASGSESWLVTSITVSSTTEHVQLVFKGSAQQAAKLVMTATLLRQWLGIVHIAYVKAQWPMQVWPEWMAPTPAPTAHAPVVLH